MREAIAAIEDGNVREALLLIDSVEAIGGYERIVRTPLEAIRRLSGCKADRANLGTTMDWSCEDGTYRVTFSSGRRSVVTILDFLDQEAIRGERPPPPPPPPAPVIVRPTSREEEQAALERARQEQAGRRAVRDAFAQAVLDGDFPALEQLSAPSILSTYGFRDVDRRTTFVEFDGEGFAALEAQLRYVYSTLGKPSSLECTPQRCLWQFEEPGRSLSATFIPVQATQAAAWQMRAVTFHYDGPGRMIEPLMSRNVED